MYSITFSLHDSADEAEILHAGYNLEDDFNSIITALKSNCMLSMFSIEGEVNLEYNEIKVTIEGLYVPQPPATSATRKNFVLFSIMNQLLILGLSDRYYISCEDICLVEGDTELSATFNPNPSQFHTQISNASQRLAELALPADLIPDAFLCPITSNVMDIPWQFLPSLDAGATMERRLAHMFNLILGEHPVLKKRIHITEMGVDYVLRDQIQNFIEKVTLLHDRHLNYGDHEEALANLTQSALEFEQSLANNVDLAKTEPWSQRAFKAYHQARYLNAAFCFEQMRDKEQRDNVTYALCLLKLGRAQTALGVFPAVTTTTMRAYGLRSYLQLIEALIDQQQYPSALGLINKAKDAAGMPKEKRWFKVLGLCCKYKKATMTYSLGRILRIAAANNQPDDLQSLLEYNPNLHTLADHKKRKTALHQAIERGHVDAAVTLVFHASRALDIADKDGNTPRKIIEAQQDERWAVLSQTLFVVKIEAKSESAKAIVPAMIDEFKEKLGLEPMQVTFYQPHFLVFSPCLLEAQSLFNFFVFQTMRSALDACELGKYYQPTHYFSRNPEDILPTARKLTFKFTLKPEMLGLWTEQKSLAANIGDFGGPLQQAPDGRDFLCQQVDLLWEKSINDLVCPIVRPQGGLTTKYDRSPLGVVACSFTIERAHLSPGLESVLRDLLTFHLERAPNVISRWFECTGIEAEVNSPALAQIPTPSGFRT